jgi:hypothetical protein
VVAAVVFRHASRTKPGLEDLAEAWELRWTQDPRYDPNAAPYYEAYPPVDRPRQVRVMAAQDDSR